jgi:prevent-host-death family protein
MSITAFEAKTRFGELLERVARGEEVVITKHDKPVARVIPEGSKNLTDVRNAIAGLRSLREDIRTRMKGRNALTNADVKSAIEEGRE